MVELPSNDLKLKREIVHQIQAQLETFMEIQFPRGTTESVFTVIRTMTLQFCDLYEANQGLSVEAMLQFYSWLCLTCSPNELSEDKKRLISQWVNGFLETFFCWSPEGTLAAINTFIDRLELQEQLKEGIFARLKKSTKPKK